MNGVVGHAASKITSFTNKNYKASVKPETPRNADFIEVLLVFAGLSSQNSSN